jgi:hypothetical protein
MNSAGVNGTGVNGTGTSGGPGGVGAYLYPWDAVGDPACADRIAGLGVDRVVLAAAYHTVRALSASHPTHKVVTASHSAVYYQPDRARWRGRAVQPAVATWAPGSFHQAAHALRDAGLGVYAWAVLTHNQRLGTLHPELAVTNAFGDRYPWALCAANRLVREYCTTLAQEIAGLPEVDGLELESCGWYGFEHLHAHDKTGAAAFSPEVRTLLSMCFCDACEIEYAEAGIAPQRLRERLRAALEPVFADAAEPEKQAGAELEAELRAVHAVRTAAADRLRAEVLSAVRAARPDLPVLLHTHPDPHRVGANPGAVPATLFAESAGAVLQCGGPPEEAAATVAAVASQAPDGMPIAATLQAVANLGGRVATLAEEAVALRAAGANELRFYHAGLASGSDLRAIREAATAWGKS